MADYKIEKFYGTNTAIKDRKALRTGVSPDSLNWITSKYKDSIELRRGYVRLGTTEVTGNGNISGIGVGVQYDGTEKLWFSYDRKIKYYDIVTDDVIEVDTADILPEAADGEDVWMQPYQNLAGSVMLAGSPNSSVYKIPVANPGSVVDQATNNYRWGVFHVGQNRVFSGARNGIVSGNNDQTGLYLSYIDKDQLSDYTEVSGEAIGSAGSQTYAGTLSVAAAPKTVMYVTISEAGGGETFKDDRNGNLVGDAGGTGTINYATGAYSVTFNVVTSGAVTADYYHETMTSAGILDFTGGANGQGKSFRQDNAAGKLMAIFNINVTNYCFHLLKTWQFTSTLDDTQSTNLEYRNVGIPYERAAHQTPDGIIMADLANPSEPKYRKMKVLQGTDINTIEPMSISDALDLSPFGHDKCVAFRWGDYEIFAVQEKVLGAANTFNSVTWVRNVVSGQWDKLNYYVSCLAELNGMLIAGDSISRNAYVLFSGFDEDGDVIENKWTSSDLDFDDQLGLGENLKTAGRMIVEGLIQKEQKMEVQASYNGGAFTTVFTIEGDADYVDQGIKISIGSQTIGSTVIGGGGSVTAAPYEVDFQLNSDRFVDIAVRFIAREVGFISVNAVTFKDVRNKGKKNTPRRTR